MLSDKIKDVEHKLSMNNTETDLLMERINKIITDTKPNSDELTEEALKHAKTWNKALSENKTTLNMEWMRLKKKRIEKIKNLAIKYRKNKKHSKSKYKNKIPMNGEKPKNVNKSEFSIKSLQLLKSDERQYTLQVHSNLCISLMFNIQDSSKLLQEVKCCNFVN